MIKVYSKPNCYQCKFVKNYLTGKGVEFEECNIMDDDKARAGLKELGYTGVPVTEAPDGSTFYGFNVDKLKLITM